MKDAQLEAGKSLNQITHMILYHLRQDRRPLLGNRKMSQSLNTCAR